MTKFDVMSDTKGFDGAMRQLKSLANDVEQRDAMDTALAAGGRVIADEWSRRAPARSLKQTRVRKGRMAARALKISRVMGLAVVGFEGAGYRLAHLFEFGTSERRKKTTGQSTGRMPMRPFARPGVDAVRDEVGAAIKASLARSIKRIQRRNG